MRTPPPPQSGHAPHAKVDKEPTRRLCRARARGRTAIALLGLLLAACTNNPYPDADAHAKVLYLSYPIAPKTLDPAVGVLGLRPPGDRQRVRHPARVPLPRPSLPTHSRPRRGRPARPGRRRTAASPIASRCGRDVLFQDDACFALGGSGRRTRTVTRRRRRLRPRPHRRSRRRQSGGRHLRQARRLPRVRRPAARAARADPGFAALRVDEQYARAGGIAGVRVLSDTELEIVLREPYPQILYWFAMPFTAPLPWEAVAYYDGRDGRDQPRRSPGRHRSVPPRPLRAPQPHRAGAQPDLVRRPPSRMARTRHGLPEQRHAGRRRSRPAGADLVGRPLPFLDRIELRRDPEIGAGLHQVPAGLLRPVADHPRELRPRGAARARSPPTWRRAACSSAAAVEATIYYLGFNMDDRGGRRRRPARAAARCARR